MKINSSQLLQGFNEEHKKTKNSIIIVKNSILKNLLY